MPNVTNEWIDELKKEIQKYNQSLNKSLDQRMRQLRIQQEHLKQGEKASNSDRFRSPDKHTPYADVSNQRIVEAKQQRLSLPNMADRYTENCYTSQGGVKPSDKNTSYLNLPGCP